MGSQAVQVRVLHAGLEVDSALTRPVRLLPDGSAGVVYAGEVFPLYQGDVIDTAGEHHAKDECGKWLGEGAAIPYRRVAPLAPARVTLWHVETNTFGHYLVFDCDQATAQSLAARVAASGLGVRRFDHSYRQADDGHQYDWFIRLAFQGSRDDCLKMVEPLLGEGIATGLPQQRAGSMAGLPVDRLDKRQTGAALQQEAELLAEAQSALRKAEATAHEAEDLVVELQTELKATKAQMEALKHEGERLESRWKRSKTTAANLRRELREVRAAQSSWSDDDALAMVQDAENRAAEATELADLYEHDLRDLKAERDDLSQQAQAAISRAQDAENHMREMRQEGAERSKLRQLRVGSTAAFPLAEWCPRIVLHPDGLELLFALSNRRDALHTLLAINDCSVKATAWTTKVSKKAGVFEVVEHVSTGANRNGDMGRFYYRKLPDGRQRVYFHIKSDDKSQVQFCQRIAAEDLSRIDEAY